MQQSRYACKSDGVGHGALSVCVASVLKRSKSVKHTYQHMHACMDALPVSTLSSQLQLPTATVSLEVLKVNTDIRYPCHVHIRICPLVTPSHPYLSHP